MNKLAMILVAGTVILTLGASAQAGLSFRTGTDSMNYSITTWSIRTDWTGAWNGKVPTYFMFDSPGWATRYTNTSGVQYWPGQSMTGTAVITDVHRDADLDAINMPADPGWVTMAGESSPISFWEHGGQFLKQSGGNDASWADDTYWASNEYGSPRSTGVVTEFTGAFQWDGAGNHVEGKILADDSAEVYINNTLIHTTDSRAYDAVETFSCDGVLVSGSNNLKVIVYDTGQGSESVSPTAGATALQLDLIPEPATMILIAGGVPLLLRRKRS